MTTTGLPAPSTTTGSARGSHRTVDDARAALDVAALAARVVADASAERTTTVIPFTGTALADLPLSTHHDVARAVRQARVAQRHWAWLSPDRRARVLRRVAERVVARRDEIADIIQLETGKARFDAVSEAFDVAINASWYARTGPRLLADAPRRALLPGITAVHEVRHPKGVVGIIAPWNYPLALTVSDALPALLAGNAVVLKPDTQTALTALWGAALLADAGLPDGLCQVVVGDGPVIGSAVVDTVDHVCFTGSTRTGREVAQQAARRLIGCSLELGGKNSLYVADDADLDRAAEGAVRDCFFNTGQICMSMERLLVHEAVADAFLARFVARVERLIASPALDMSSDVGCLTTDAQVQKVTRHVDDAVARGARVLTGGHPLPDVGPRFFAPTVLDAVPREAACSTEETFGPVVSIRRVRSDDEAVAVANSTPFGLSAAVWTRDAGRGAAIARRLRTGTVTINEAHTTVWSAVASPMGGRGDSGIGRRHGAEGLLRFTESQSVARQRVGLHWLHDLGAEHLLSVLGIAFRVAGRVRWPWP